MKTYILFICVLLFSCKQSVVHNGDIITDSLSIRKIDYVNLKNKNKKIDVEYFFAIQTDKIQADSILIDSIDKFILDNILDTIELNDYDHFGLQFIKESDEMKRIKTDENGVYNINIYSAHKRTFLNYDWYDGMFQNKFINGRHYLYNFDTIPPPVPTK